MWLSFLATKTRPGSGGEVKPLLEHGKQGAWMKLRLEAWGKVVQDHDGIANGLWPYAKGNGEQNNLPVSVFYNMNGNRVAILSAGSHGKQSLKRYYRKYFYFNHTCNYPMNRFFFNLPSLLLGLCLHHLVHLVFAIAVLI
ncbi:hypothetical protein HJG60_011697 [Phyllostomus discolor]|uniref:Uncharacterized protein n=1 Tax=Phyllostomus discolor TaxID=89673 RepID=A0A834E1D6_9CHIR|nr:hypothetical protein HJG60_011697 [Phyllostomus discolor]